MPNETSLWSRIRQRFSFADALRLANQPPLIDRGFGLIYDTERDITWLQDVNYAKTVGRSRDGQLTWPDAVAWVHSLDYRGIRGWRLPNAKNPDGSGPVVGNNAVGSEVGHLYLDVFANHPGVVQLKNGMVPCNFWTGTEANANEVYAFGLFELRQGTLAKNPWADEISLAGLFGPVLTWPLHDGDVAAELRWRLLRTLITSVFRR
ncbi:MAG: DUF1566 domain-containing protein [Verrucomicrobiota bacterium]|nr:DUF1566 domain-containing protein [Verrucomicrobiota bacterium]